MLPKLVVAASGDKKYSPVVTLVVEGLVYEYGLGARLSRIGVSSKSVFNESLRPPWLAEGPPVGGFSEAAPLPSPEIMTNRLSPPSFKAGGSTSSRSGSWSMVPRMHTAASSSVKEVVEPYSRASEAFSSSTLGEGGQRRFLCERWWCDLDSVRRGGRSGVGCERYGSW